MADLRNLKHDQTGTRDSLATVARDAIQNGAGTQVTIDFFAETLDAQSTVILSIDLGNEPFGTGAITNQAFTYTGTATGTKATTNTHTVQSFAIFDRATTPVKVLRGSAGSTTATHTYDVSIAGGASIKQNEKIKLTSFTYTASL